MPHYELFCHACKQLFSKTLSPAEYEEGNVVCPHCGSEEVEQRVSAFYPVSFKESARTCEVRLCASTSFPSVPSRSMASPATTTW